MVRFKSSIGAEDPKQIKAFNWSGYRFDDARSSEDEYVFIRTEVAWQEMKKPPSKVWKMALINGLLYLITSRALHIRRT